MPINKDEFFRSLKKFVITLLALIVFAIVYMDAWLLEKFEGKKWSLPAVVYARPLELFEGREIYPKDVVRELKASGYRQNTSGESGSYQMNGQVVKIYQRRFYLPGKTQDAQTVSIRFSNGRITSLKASSGSAFSVRLEPIEVGRIHPQKQEDRLLVSIDQVPQSLIDALVITEDREFYSHIGVSPKSIARAIYSNIKEGKVVQGGSTLTQQLIKNFFLSSERSYLRKIIEAIMALLLEIHAYKDEILEAYINEVFVAQSGGRAIHGFGLASQHFFGRSLDRLEVHQTALLVAMMKGPSYYNPVRHPDRALQRRNLVIKLMADHEKISQLDAEAARQRSLGLLGSREMPASYPSYLDLVRRQLRRDYSQKELATQGLRIFSNMDPQWQWQAQSELQKGIKRIESSYGKKAVGIDGGAVIIDSVNSDVLAVVGSKIPRVSGFNRALDARRPIGSLVKPAIYLTAFENDYHLMSKISDDALSIDTPQGVWQPQNYDRVFHGEVPLYRALAKSYNVAATRIGLKLGIKEVATTLNKLGIEQRIPKVPAMMLGSIDLAPINVAQMYATVAAKGFYSPLKSINEITDNSGNVLKRYPFKLQQRFSGDVMHLLDYGLQNVMHEGTGQSVVKRFKPNSVISGKTGTTNDQRDSWFAGYDANKLGVVWLGRDDNLPLPVTGSSGALPIWADIISSNVNTRGRTNVPDTVSYHWVDKNSGKLSGELCEQSIYMPYIHGTEPKQKAGCIMSSRTIIHWFKKWFQ